ncbi:hypothetical protein AB0442_08585 [Kitasatospora sp. NPDC085895]|uniref:hypothetical protein n=1 Tax=Kitasatospora sp. NPDC085895 TaxID=3155057 RepID=UPI00344DD9F9
MTLDVLGLDKEDWQQVAHWLGGVTEFVTGLVLTPERRRHCLDCAEQLEAHLAPVVERRRPPATTWCRCCARPSSTASP